MKRTRFITAVVILLGFFITGSLQAQEQHWECDPYAYEYDMTAYVTLKVNNRIVSNPANYEIAAFCGTSCRGVAKLMTEDDGSKYYYLRIRSKKASGEQIKFCVYNYADDTEIWAENTVSFISQSAVGYPSNPFVLRIVEFQMGDVNRDGSVDIVDAIWISNYTIGKGDVAFDTNAADVNHDDIIDIADAVQIVNFVVGNTSALAPRHKVILPDSE